MTQDQWDIYKLDPLYECFVPIPSHTTKIRAVPSKLRPSSPPLTRKRQLSSCSPPPQRAMPPPTPEKHTFVQIQSDDDDEDEVEAMVISNEQPLLHLRAIVKKRRERTEKKMQERQQRRKKIKEKVEFFSQKDDEDEMSSNVLSNGSTFNPCIQPLPQELKRKSREDLSWSADSREVEELRVRLAKNDIFSSKMRKKTRTPSPSAVRKEREFQRRKMKRDRNKQRRRMQETEARRRERDRRLLEEILEEIPSVVLEHDAISDISVSDASMTEDNPSPQTRADETQRNGLPDEEDEAHRQAIQESRRKLAELERDRPLWEEQAKQRRLCEEMEQRAYRTQAERRRWEEVKKQTEIEIRIRKECEEAETRKCEQEENVRRERELRDQERRQRRQRWSFGPWTTQRALERYRVLSESFDVTKFTFGLPLNVEDVPWPLLQSPRYFSVEDVSWDSVERFFEAIRPHLRHQDFKTLVEQSHRRFHPDRWRSRNLLKTVEDETIRDCMEVAANTVAQALTPIWRSLRDQ
ncbi:hypothetical protein Ac2012v2_004937 [Leucoagaricus gongylophorus]